MKKSLNIIWIVLSCLVFLTGCSITKSVENVTNEPKETETEKKLDNFVNENTEKEVDIEHFGEAFREIVETTE